MQLRTLKFQQQHWQWPYSPSLCLVRNLAACVVQWCNQDSSHHRRLRGQDWGRLKLAELYIPIPLFLTLLATDSTSDTQAGVVICLHAWRRKKTEDKFLLKKKKSSSHMDVLWGIIQKDTASIFLHCTWIQQFMVLQDSPGTSYSRISTRIDVEEPFWSTTASWRLWFQIRDLRSNAGFSSIHMLLLGPSQTFGTTTVLSH